MTHAATSNTAHSRTWRWLSIGAAMLLLPSIGAAQTPLHARASDAAINAAIGGATGAVTAALRGQSVWRGLQRGVAGGLVMAAGRQIAGTRATGMPVIGREISGVGISLVAAGGDSTIHYLFPVGPATIVVVPGQSVDWRLNIAQTVEMVALAVSPNTTFDASRSLAAGAPVFRDRRPHFGESRDNFAVGSEGLGAIRLAPEIFTSSGPETSRALAHESIHVMQEDFLNDAITLPIERAILQHVPFGRELTRHLDVGVLTLVLGNAATGIQYKDRPWEREAYSLTGDPITQ